MAKAKKKTVEDLVDELNVAKEDVEKVEGRVEGLTYSDEEQKIRAETREKWLSERQENVYGTNRSSQITGMILLNRARNAGMREREFSCGAELAGAIDAYWQGLFIDQEKGSEVMPDVEAMADYLGITRATMLRWARGEDNLEFVPPLQLALSEIATAKKQRAFTDKINGLVYLNDMQNNHGYLANTKQNEVSLNVRLKHELPSIEQLNRQMGLLE